MAVNVHRHGQARNMTGVALHVHGHGSHLAAEPFRTDAGLVHRFEKRLFERCQFEFRIWTADGTEKRFFGKERRLLETSADTNADHDRRTRVCRVLADYVTAEDGTGCVHTAPGHGREDYETGIKYGIEIYCPVGDAGEFTEGLAEYKGKTVFDANQPIIDLLKSCGTLVGPPGWLTHSYPHCWRCHNPVIFRANEQWFINIDHEHLRERALEGIKKFDLELDRTATVDATFAIGVIGHAPP